MLIVFGMAGERVSNGPVVLLPPGARAGSCYSNCGGSMISERNEEGERAGGAVQFGFREQHHPPD